MASKQHKRLIGEAMQGLQNAVFEQNIAVMFQYEAQLKALTNEAFSMDFLQDLTNSNKGTNNVLIDGFLQKIFEEVE